jgi:hypothetical protein
MAGQQKLTVRSLAEAYAEAFTGVRPRRQERTADDAIIETYLEHANITGHSERETRAVWALYRQLTDGKPLKDATRDDGRKVVQHFERQGLRSATIQKKITWLNAGVNLAIKESKLTFNPFSSVVPKRDDKQVRFPLSEADIKNAKQNLGQLDKRDQLLFRLLAASIKALAVAWIWKRNSDCFAASPTKRARRTRMSIQWAKPNANDQPPKNLSSSIPHAVFAAGSGPRPLASTCRQGPCSTIRIVPINWSCRRAKSATEAQAPLI